MLYPKINSYRDVYNLNGVWNYKTVEEDYVPSQKATETQLMAVPASCNDIVTDRKLRTTWVSICLKRLSLCRLERVKNIVLELAQRVIKAKFI